MHACQRQFTPETPRFCTAHVDVIGILAAQSFPDMDDAPDLPTGRCPVCNTDDTYLGQRTDRDEYFIECLNCGV